MMLRYNHAIVSILLLFAMLLCCSGGCGHGEGTQVTPLRRAVLGWLGESFDLTAAAAEQRLESVLAHVPLSPTELHSSENAKTMWDAYSHLGSKYVKEGEYSDAFRSYETVRPYPTYPTMPSRIVLAAMAGQVQWLKSEQAESAGFSMGQKQVLEVALLYARKQYQAVVQATEGVPSQLRQATTEEEGYHLGWLIALRWYAEQHMGSYSESVAAMNSLRRRVRALGSQDMDWIVCWAMLNRLEWAFSHSSPNIASTTVLCKVLDQLDPKLDTDVSCSIMKRKIAALRTKISVAEKLPGAVSAESDDK